MDLGERVALQEDHGLTMFVLFGEESCFAPLELHQEVGFEKGEFFAISIVTLGVGDWEGGW